MRQVAILNYGSGNLFSVARAFEIAGTRVLVATEPDEILGADALVLPGVGHFGKAASFLREGAVEAISDFMKAGRLIVGICLGMQLLYDESEEAPGEKGLGFIHGAIRRFPPGIRVPHLGWNTVIIQDDAPAWLRDISGKWFYFAHSFFWPGPAQATTEYQDVRFASLVVLDNIVGFQFHPEKSGGNGLEIIRRILNWK